MTNYLEVRRYENSKKWRRAATWRCSLWQLPLSGSWHRSRILCGYSTLLWPRFKTPQKWTLSILEYTLPQIKPQALTIADRYLQLSHNLFPNTATRLLLIIVVVIVSRRGPSERRALYVALWSDLIILLCLCVTFWKVGARQSMLVRSNC